jgi:chromosome segregation ATPase
VTDDGTDKPSNAQPGNAGASKDVLFGWLVGRAAADLGLAQALAASEAQHADKFKQLEASLLAQIQELQHSPNAPFGAANQSSELEQLKAAMQSIFERMGGLESLAQQFADAPDLLKHEMARLEAEWGTRQSLVEGQYSRSEKVASDLVARVGQLENQKPAKPEDLDHAISEIVDLKLALQSLTDRIARVDLATQTIQTHTVSEIERTEKFASEFIKEESAALKAEVFQRLRDYAPTDAIVQRLDEQGQKRADELRDGIEQNTSSLARLAADQGALRSDLQRFSERLETMPMALAVDFATERDRLNHEVDDRVAVRLREFADAIRQEVSAVEELKVDRGHVDTEINSLADRMAHIEGAIEQATTGVRLELSSIKTELSQQQSQLQPAAALLQNVEETLRTKIAAIQDYLAHEQQSFRTRDLQQREFETQLQRLAQRLRETESTVQQTHALMINETAQAAQQREGLMTELITLRTQLGDAPARYAVMDRFEENLQAKFRDLQNQLAQNAATVDRRDSELRDLKAQVQSLIEQVARAETGLASSEFSMAERVPESPAVSLELITTNAPPPENRPSMVASRLAAAARGAHRLAGGEGPRDLLVEGEDPVKSLQERMSADIERARAELREKSGRWKVRR